MMNIITAIQLIVHQPSLRIENDDLKTGNNLVLKCNESGNGIYAKRKLDNNQEVIIPLLPVEGWEIKRTPDNFMDALEACIKHNKSIMCKFLGKEEIFSKDNCLMKNIGHFLQLIYYGEWYILDY